MTRANAEAGGRRRGRRRPGRWAVLALGAALGAAAGGCGEPIAGTDPDTGLRVEVRRGPIEPVGRPGVDNSAPVEGARVRVRRTDDGGSLRGRTGAEGTVRLLLVPGAYRVEVEECPGALGLPNPADAEVRSGEVSEVRLDCDTGIR